MSQSNETARSLRERKKLVDLSIKELITLSDSLSLVISHVEGTGVQTELDIIIENVSASDNGIGLTGFIRRLFQSYPDKKWTVKALRAEVQASNVTFGGQHLDESIYSVLSRLIKHKEIKKGGIRGKQRWYKKAEMAKI